ncbi:MAG: hypothetical protein LBF26_02850 [Puniceicoccales bacterium]|jgi:hypothetical protein|nr:hypothetical protein [Puniceicoccales bacterium]
MKRQRTSGWIRFLDAGLALWGTDFEDFFDTLDEDFLETLPLIVMSDDIVWG